jgi:hypothetical protein
MHKTVELFLNHFCRPLRLNPTPGIDAKLTLHSKLGQLCYEVTNFSWDILADLVQTVTVLDDNRFWVATESSPGGRWAYSTRESSEVILQVSLREDITLADLHAVLIYQAKEASLIWMATNEIVEHYQHGIEEYSSLIERFEGSRENLDRAKCSLQKLVLGVEELDKYKKGKEINSSLLDLHEKVDFHCSKLYDLLYFGKHQTKSEQQPDN